MSTNAYNKTLERFRSAAERIRQGRERGIDPATQGKQTGGIMKRMAKVREQYEEPKQSNPMSTVLDYYTELKTQREKLQEERNLQEPHADTPATTLMPTANEAYVAREALARIESSDNYKAMGKVIDNPNSMYHGDRAYGRYQVMGRNIADWSKQALGKSVSKEEFLASPSIQDAIVEWKLSLEKEKHGTWEDAVAVWFSGNPVEGNTAKDVTSGIDVPKYLQNFRNAYNSIASELLDTADASPTAEAGDQGIMKRRVR